MSQLLKFGLILCAICLAATLVLAVTYQVTKPKIEEQLRREEREALETILPEADSFTEKSVDGLDYYEALKGGELKGYCVKVTGSGYNGFIRMIVGVNPAGVIEGVEVLEQQETPGLGADINKIKPGEKDPWFLRQFKGKDAATLEVKKNIDAITGATISSRAVTDAVRKTITEFLAKVKR
ncbi:MAG: RnfABCDGE type electron transport complex subunit G [Candidatus Omnitrophica bacterium]|nr:RnfABCDGE type electron transport complex subunit G [Candidatus Omnitrophota bacterium]